MERILSKRVVALQVYDPDDPQHAVIAFDGVYQNVARFAAVRAAELHPNRPCGTRASTMQQNIPPKMTLIVGPCVIEDEGLTIEIAGELKRQLADLPVDLYFKASFDKANRTSIEGFRGPGIEEGLSILSKVKARHGVKLLTDVHDTSQVLPTAEVVDFVQIPAFLSRQTDLIAKTAETALRFNRKLNIKKGQFLAPWDAKNIVEKVRATERKCSPSAGRSEDWIYLTERGVSFGYNTLVVDMTAFQAIQKFGVPVLYDATHSVQSPGAGTGGTSTGGKRENIEVLARAAMAAGADGLFMECHPDPSRAKSDGPNAFYLEQVGAFVRQMLAIRSLVAPMPKLLPEAFEPNGNAHGNK